MKTEPPKGPDKRPDINDIHRIEGVEGVRKKHDTAQKIVPINSSKPVPKTNGHAGLMDTTATIVTKKASDYTMAALDWLWPGRFALGKLGLIGGLPDRGKGLICCDLIACVTNNHPLPCNEGKCPQGNVIYFAAEDDGDDTVVPRLVAAGADLDKVHIVEMVDDKGKRRGFNLVTDIDLLRKKIEEIGNVVLVIIDPISAYLGSGKVNTGSTTDVRGFLMPLKDLAKEKMVSIIGIIHFNKKQDVHDVMLRIADSLAYAATARHVYCVVDDPEVEHQRLLVKAKNNAVGPASNNMSYLTGKVHVGHDPKRDVEIWAPRIEWGKRYVETTATEAMQAASSGGYTAQSQLKEAMAFLEKMLADGPVLQRDVKQAAEAHDIAKSTLKRARQRLKVGNKITNGPKGNEYYWEMPPAPPTKINKQAH